MKQFNINQILEHIYQTVENHKIETGRYARWIFPEYDTGVNAYGCADAANILYTLNRMPMSLEERKACIEGIQMHQNSETGLFEEGTHLLTHSTAHCVAALELFDARPLHPCYDFEKYQDLKTLNNLLEGLSWKNAAGPGHIAPAIYSTMVITGTASEAWLEYYFDWLDSNCDPEIGFWRKGTYPSETPIFTHMGDGFHFLFTYVHGKRAFPYPEKIIDSCIEMYYRNKEDKFFDNIVGDFGKNSRYIEMDWVFCLNRASRQTKHRFDEVQSVLLEFAEMYIDWLNNADWETNQGLNDLHMLFGTTCCLAELQLALPGVIHSHVPLRLVLDRRPFI